MRRRRSLHATAAPRRKGHHGFSTLELLLALALITLAGGVAAGASRYYRTRATNLGAARLLRTQVRLARAYAIREGLHVGLAFEARDDGEYQFRLVADGNGNGVRTADVRSGADPPIGTPVWLSAYFAPAAVRLDRDAPALDGGSRVSAGTPPIRLAGGSSILSLTPTGTATSGTVFVSGPGGGLLALRIAAATGRLRLFELAGDGTSWNEQW
ncbi:MAG: GspH/FimT family pseudopilin [Vicinamibacterales bacterium]